METEKTLEEKMIDLETMGDSFKFDGELIAPESVDQLIKAHELKYMENLLEVEEEKKLVYDNLKDFEAYDEETRAAAFIAKEKAMRDPEYFGKPEADQKLYKPVMILMNIDSKKNEAKIKTWKVDYHARLIRTLTSYRFFAGKKLVEKPSLLKLIIDKFIK